MEHGTHSGYFLFSEDERLTAVRVLALAGYHEASEAMREHGRGKELDMLTVQLVMSGIGKLNGQCTEADIKLLTDFENLEND
jgi:hypothetical protein